MAIKWRDQDIQALESAVKSFNAKVGYHRSRGNEAMPATISINAMKSGIKSRSDFNRELHRIERFKQADVNQYFENKHGVKITKYEQQELQRQVNTINARRTRLRNELQSLEMTSRGKSLGYTRAEMGTVIANELKPKVLNFNTFRAKSEIGYYNKAVLKQMSTEYLDLKDERFRANYIKSLETAFGTDANDVINKLKQMPVKDFVKMTYKDIDAKIRFNYDKQDSALKLNTIRQIWGVTPPPQDTEEFFKL